MTRHVVEKIVAGGIGLLRTDEGVVFARAVLPGELIELGPLTRRRGTLWADAPTILEPSPERVTPACRYFPTCGGCDFQHASRAAELSAKLAATADTLRRISGRDVAARWADGIETLPPLGYRNTIRIQGGAGWLGYCEKHSHSIVDIEDCPLGQPPIREGIRAARAAAAREKVKSATLRCGKDEELVMILTSHGRTRMTGGPLHIELAGRSYRVDPRAFFQVNTAAAGLIVRDLRADLVPGPRLLDLFAGVGAFAIALADRFDQVSGWEIAREAVDDFRFNASGLANVDMATWDAAQGLKVPLAPTDVVIVDPPRTGLPDRLRSSLTDEGNARPRQLAYVSCDPATFARDLAALAGCWRLSGPVRLYDMFSRTAHVELMAILEPQR